MPMRFRRSFAAVILTGMLVTGCASPPARIEAVPAGREAEATVVGFPYGIRYYPRDAHRVEEFQRDWQASIEREREWARAHRGTDDIGPANFLAISGGGDNGAFGAGILNGWTKSGTRPEFKLVTGVSTGALIAPFAFLGPEYDAKLKSFYTDISHKDVSKERSMLAALFSDSVADSTPLQKLVLKVFDRSMLDAIAAEHEKGRVLLIATTNLDTRRAVIWNITEIAASKAPSALNLFQEILVASAAIPGTFPPVMITVEVDGRFYQEMHVDGGTAAQVFAYPAAVHLFQLYPRERKLYIIRNARMDPQWAQVDRRVLTIAFRAITCLVQNQGIGDLYRIYSTSQRDHVDFNLAFIPPTFQASHTHDFDTAYMRSLFDLGYQLAGAGYPWSKHPPVLVSGVDVETDDTP